MTAELGSSSSGDFHSPSSLAPRCVVVHEGIVSPIGSVRKCGTRNPSYAQWGSVQAELEAMPFHKRVSWVRKALGLTHKEAARRWGYSKTQVIAWEKERAEPSWSRWNEIEAAALEELFEKATGTEG